MNQDAIGKFIATCRKEKRLTQMQLAEKLNITDRAVSKWETGKCMPDSSIMLELCELLDISVNELLSGERIKMDGNEEKAGIEDYVKKADENLIALKRRDENYSNKNRLAAIIYSAILLLAGLVCMICDVSVTGSLSWSLIPLSSLMFAWLLCFPLLRLGKNGIIWSLAALSIFIIPFLYILRLILAEKNILTIGAVMSAITLVYVWAAYGLFMKLCKRKFLAAGIVLIIAAPFTLLINVVLDKMMIMLDETTQNTAGSVIDVWDILSVFILLLLSYTFFLCDHAKQKRRI